MLLLVYFSLYFFLAFVWRSYLVYRRTGQSPLVLPTDDSAYGYVGRAFKAVMAAIALVVVLQALYPHSLDAVGGLHALRTPLLLYAGWGLLLVSLAWLLVAQAQMGNAWRIGIDAQNATELVEHGLFGVSRNPIFLAMRVNLLGLFLVLPNAITLSTLVAGELLMQVQVRLEEAHLSALHGPAYTGYQSRVRRWL